MLKKIYLHLFIFLLFHHTAANAQEWSVMSPWKPSDCCENLWYRTKIKYTTSDTYALRIEWKNTYKEKIRFTFTLRDRSNVKESYHLELPAGKAKEMWGGTSFRNRDIDIQVSSFEFIASSQTSSDSLQPQKNKPTQVLERMEWGMWTPWKVSKDSVAFRSRTKQLGTHRYTAEIEFRNRSSRPLKGYVLIKDEHPDDKLVPVQLDSLEHKKVTVENYLHSTEFSLEVWLK